jgi:hypothetical protein
MNNLSSAVSVRVRDLVNELANLNDGWTYSLVAPPGSGKTTSAVLLASDSLAKRPNEPMLVVASVDALVRYRALLDGVGVRSRRWDLADLREHLSASAPWEPIAHLIADEFVAGTTGQKLGALPWSLVIIDGKGVTTSDRLIDSLQTNKDSRVFLIQSQRADKYSALQRADKYSAPHQWTPLEADYTLPERRIVRFRRSDNEISAIAALPRIAASKEGRLEKLDAAAASSLSALLRTLNGITNLSVGKEVERLTALECLGYVAVDQKVAALSALLHENSKTDAGSIVLSASSATLGYLETCLADFGFTVQRLIRGQSEPVSRKIVLSNYTSARNIEVQACPTTNGQSLPMVILYDLPEDLETWLEVMAMTRQPVGATAAKLIAFQEETGGTAYERMLLNQWGFLPSGE